MTRRSAAWVWVGVCAAAVAVSGLTGAGAQSEGSTVWDGVYTDEQAARGQELYTQECAACHLDDLMGDGFSPALAGSDFSFRWTDLALNDLYDMIQATMPQGAPNTLSPEGYADVVSYLLQVNGFPAGDDELPADSALLEAIAVTAGTVGTAAGGGIWDGVYTEDQAVRGKDAYEQECAACHLDDLMGDGIAPALTGAAFDFRWADLAVGDMYVAIRATMPQGAPASLSPQRYVDIVSYMLQVNEFPAGDQELPADEAALNEIIITPQQ